MSGSLTNILFVITSTELGGAEKILCKLAAHLHRRGTRVAVCSLKPPGHYLRELQVLGIEVHSLSLHDAAGVKGALSSLWCLPRLVGLICRLHPQVVHAFLFRANLLSRVAAWLCRVPVNISSIRIVESQRPFYCWLDRWTSFMVTQHLAVSERVKEATVRRSGIAPERIRVIRNGVDLEGCRPASSDDATSARLKEQHGLQPGQRVCGTVARMRPQKGIEYLLQAFSLLGPRFPDLRLLLVGDGPERVALEQLALQLGVRERVTFAGLVSPPWPYLRLMDVFVLPSLYEGLPNAVLEAMATGVPAVATDVGGVPELIEDQRTGLLVPPGDTTAIAAAVEQLLRDSGRARAMADAARKSVAEQFTLDRMLQEYDSLYARLLAPGRRQ